MEQVSEQAVHGALDYGELERLGLDPGDIFDFSVNTNPYGPSPLVQQAIAQAALDRYPDRECLQLRRIILAYEIVTANLSLNSTLCGNGTAELIWALAHTFLQPDRKAAIVGPTFGEYRAASLASGATVVAYTAQAADHFHLDLSEVSAWIQAEQPSLLWLCNPNNPTGTWLDRQALVHLAEACESIGALLVIDEAYWRFLIPQEAFSAVELLGQPGGAHLLVLRSLTKDFALAGVRLGYAVASEDIIARLHACLPSWNVSTLAQAAGIAAVMDPTHLTRTLGELAGERRDFFSALHDLGVRIIPSRTHFCLVEVGDAHALRQQLLARHILVRDCTSFELPEYIRVATRQRSEWQQFVRTLREVL
jgi:histidinol-phosphate aminotransferase